MKAMTARMLGRAIGVSAVAVFAVVAVPSVTAHADTCYVGCSPPTTQSGSGSGPGTGAGGGKTGSSGGTSGTGGTGPATGASSGAAGGGPTAGSGSSLGSAAGAAASGAATSAAGGSLPFTGADIEELSVAGGVALVLGGVLVRRSRRRRARA